MSTVSFHRDSYLISYFWCFGLDTWQFPPLLNVLNLNQKHYLP